MNPLKHSRVRAVGRERKKRKSLGRFATGEVRMDFKLSYIFFRIIRISDIK